MGEPLRVLIVWQGADAAAVKEELSDRFKAWEKAQNQDPRNVDWVDVGQSVMGAQNSFLDLAVQKMAECDAALVIQAPDERLASSAGNLWLEAGYWIADRGREGLFIAQQAGRDVSLPSDIAGWVCVNFVSDEQLHAELAKWLDSQRERASRTSFEDLQAGDAEWIAPRSKVRATLGDKFADWMDDHGAASRWCPVEGAGSESARDALTLLAELIRMERALSEVADLAAQLGRIAHTSHVLLSKSAFVLRDPGAHAPADPLFEELGELSKSLKELCREKPEPWTRLEQFLQRRMKPFLHEHRRRKKLAPALPDRPEKKLTELVRLCTLYSEQGATAQLMAGLSSDKPRLQSRARVKLATFGEYCGDFSIFLNDFREQWVERTREAMAQHLKAEELNLRHQHVGGTTGGSLASLNTALRSLAVLSRKLPHNQRPDSGGWPVGIWRRSEQHGTSRLST